MALIGEMKYLTIGGKTYQIPVPESGSSVEFTPNLTSGTKVGDLTIDSSTVSLYAPTNTDTKLQIAAVTSGTTYYPVVAANSTTAATRQYDATGLAYAGTNGTTSAVGTAKITLGNSTASGTANNKKGQITLYGSTAYATTIDPGSPTAARTITLPDKAGTVALTSDIPSVPDVSGKIDTAGTGLSKSGTTLNHSNSITEQTVQAVYPIKIDAQGHISAYGSAVTIPSDVNVTSTAVTDATTNYLVGSTSSLTTTGTLSKHASAYIYTTANSTTNGYTQLVLGNTTATSSAGGKEGRIQLYGTNATYYAYIRGGSQTSNHTITLPDAGGTVALTKDIPDVSGKIDTAGAGLAKDGTKLYHRNSITAQTTRAIYPITFDTQGHINSYGSAITIPSAGTSASAVGTTASGGSASTYSKSDHVHNITSSTITTALGYTPGQTTVQIVRW